MTVKRHNSLLIRTFNEHQKSIKNLFRGALSWFVPSCEKSTQISLRGGENERQKNAPFSPKLAPFKRYKITITFVPDIFIFIARPWGPISSVTRIRHAIFHCAANMIYFIRIIMSGRSVNLFVLWRLFITKLAPG